MAEEEKTEISPQLIFNLVLKKLQRKNISFILKQNRIEPKQMQAWENKLISQGSKIFEKAVEEEEQEEEQESTTGTTLIIKKVTKGHAGHHGGAWKVAYADFVTAMMAFFLLMWLVSMTDEAQKLGITEYFEKYSMFKNYGATDKGGKEDKTDIGLPQKKQADIEVNEDPYNKMTDALQKEIRSQFGSMPDQVQMDFTAEGFRIQLVDRFDSPTFDSGSAKLKPWPRELIAIVAKTIMDLQVKIGFEGYTDAIPFNNKGITNWELSALRAAAAKKEFAKNGIPETRFARIVGYADRQLLIPEDPSDPRNRRIAITLLR